MRCDNCKASGNPMHQEQLDGDRGPLMMWCDDQPACEERRRNAPRCKACHQTLPADQVSRVAQTAMHASAPAGLRCSDCTIDQRACRGCLAVFAQQGNRSADSSSTTVEATPCCHEYANGQPHFEGCSTQRTPPASEPYPVSSDATKHEIGDPVWTWKTKSLSTGTTTGERNGRVTKVLGDHVSYMVLLDGDTHQCCYAPDMLEAGTFKVSPEPEPEMMPATGKGPFAGDPNDLEAGLSDDRGPGQSPTSASNEPEWKCSHCGTMSVLFDACSACLEPRAALVEWRRASVPHDERRAIYESAVRDSEGALSDARDEIDRLRARASSNASTECTCRGDLRGWDHLSTCPKYSGAADDAKAESDYGDCTFTERESAIKALRAISAMVEHDSPVYLIAVEEWSSLAHEQGRASTSNASTARIDSLVESMHKKLPFIAPEVMKEEVARYLWTAFDRGRDEPRTGSASDGCTAGDGCAIPCRHCGAPAGVQCSDHVRVTSNVSTGRQDVRDAAHQVCFNLSLPDNYEEEIAAVFEPLVVRGSGSAPSASTNDGWEDGMAQAASVARAEATHAGTQAKSALLHLAVTLQKLADNYPESRTGSASNEDSDETNAQGAVAYLRNKRPGMNTTDACAGNWTTCWCDDCEKRRLLKASGKAFTNYEVFNLTLAEVKTYIAEVRGSQ